MEKTKVIFRFWLDGVNEVIALFPEIIADDSPYHCQSYEHVGQHGGCCPPSIVEHSRPAKKREYQPLYRELVKAGYHLEVVNRLTQQHLATRKAEVKRLYPKE